MGIDRILIIYKICLLTSQSQWNHGEEPFMKMSPKKKKSLGDSQSQSRVINDWGWWACEWTNTYSWISSTIQGVRGWEKHWWSFNKQVILRIEIEIFYTWNPTLSFLIKRPLFSLKLVHSIISRGDVTLLCGLKPLFSFKTENKTHHFHFLSLMLLQSHLCQIKLFAKKKAKNINSSNFTWF